ncbi:dehydrogenase E1 and transketolase domain-containing protein 1 [Irpex rosettiformis]|uniref:Dehydrogenase E1 and transketolase domain-containing protein 1 n=1 Tax=Irpex rosettiformis TaxID=378272 RepID=A0ACB8TRA1_9APHY|nr:dehydrogenase E1 and transketolase domain-containing protein 1 [Irpex rosettiformis]
MKLYGRLAVGARASCTSLGRRAYHDTSYGYREAKKFTLPDYSPTQLENRTINAPLLRYVDSLRTHGHRAARIDPLDLLQREEVAALNPTRYGLTDPAQKYDINGIVWTRPVEENTGRTEWSLENITKHLRDIYVSRIAYEYMHSPSKTERMWFSHLLESEADVTLLNKDNGIRRRTHELLVRSETFDQFLQNKFPNLKRYGLEGGESMLSALDALFRAASEAGVEHAIIGMPHRGRLNFLTSLLEYSPRALFHKIKGGYEIPEELGAGGDVISHLTASPTLKYPNAASGIKVSLLPNPSHLEAVNPVALGKTRAKQFSLLKNLPVDVDCYPGDKVMCVQLHGDSSFTGQGVIMEGFGLSNLPHYTVGGSVHIVVNNSIGYTTRASESRSSLYCSDIGKMINAPVLHVNGDHPEDVARAVEVAFKYRNHFRKDIIVDLIVYRRWGHNELDEPAFTQPVMYKQIRSRQSVPTLYEEQLISERVISSETAKSVRESYKAYLNDELSKSDSYTPSASMLQQQWAGLLWPGSQDAVRSPETGVDQDTLVKVGKASVDVPEDFEIHSRLHRHVKPRLQSLESGKNLDWATAEALAFGSLMLEGYDVRISGQDVGRGTFSQRHAMLVDQKTERVVVPLNAALGAEGRLELANSSLSEMAVLGFEYGVSWERPNILPIWEAQFGDFFNGAQIMIDTFVSSAETKWLKQSGIVLLLPHGLDGAGPEHSSSRIERMLQLSNDRFDFPTDTESDQSTNVNIHVVFPTTPAQYFHLLRRQMKRNFRKPLVVAGPKALLRLPAAASTISEMVTGTKFQPVLADPAISDPSKVERVVLLTGKLYYDLVKARATKEDLLDKIAFVRLEELSPFPFHELKVVLERYEHVKDLVWVQEEPRNQGAWTFVGSRIREVLTQLKKEGKLESMEQLEPRYVGRKEDAVPAPGVARLYAAQQKEVVGSIFEGL